MKKIKGYIHIYTGRLSLTMIPPDFFFLSYFYLKKWEGGWGSSYLKETSSFIPFKKSAAPCPSYSVAALPFFCCCPPLILLLPSPYSVAALPLFCCCPPLILLLLSPHSVAALPFFCCCPPLILLLHSPYSVAALPLCCCCCFTLGLFLLKISSSVM